MIFGQVVLAVPSKLMTLLKMSLRVKGCAVDRPNNPTIGHCQHFFGVLPARSRSSRPWCQIQEELTPCLICAEIGTETKVFPDISIINPVSTPFFLPTFHIHLSTFHILRSTFHILHIISMIAITSEARTSQFYYFISSPMFFSFAGSRPGVSMFPGLPLSQKGTFRPPGGPPVPIIGCDYPY